MELEVKLPWLLEFYKKLQIRCASSNFSCYHLVTSISFRKFRITYVRSCDTELRHFLKINFNIGSIEGYFVSKRLFH